jgi:hypothetical protein
VKVDNLCVVERNRPNFISGLSDFDAGTLAFADEPDLHFRHHAQGP